MHNYEVGFVHLFIPSSAWTFLYLWTADFYTHLFNELRWNILYFWT